MRERNRRIFHPSTSPPLHPSAPRLHAIIRFQRRRRASQQDRHALKLPALDRDVAAVVARGGVLLVTGFVFFIDDDHSQVGNRRENRRSRPYHDLCMTH